MRVRRVYHNSFFRTQTYEISLPVVYNDGDILVNYQNEQY